MHLLSEAHPRRENVSTTAHPGAARGAFQVGIGLPHGVGRSLRSEYGLRSAPLLSRRLVCKTDTGPTRERGGRLRNPRCATRGTRCQETIIGTRRISMNILFGDLTHGLVLPTADTAAIPPEPSTRAQDSFPASEPDIESEEAGPEEKPVPLSMPGQHKMLSTNDLGSAAASHGHWLWSGYLAPGALTLLSSQWKTGKTTLLSVLLAKLNTGGTLAGLPVTPGKALVVSEEPPVLWYERSKYLNFGDHIRWLCRPFKTKPTMEQWLSFLDYLAELHRQEARNLIVIDTLAKLLPAKCESSADAMLAALMPLQQLTDRSLS